MTVLWVRRFMVLGLSGHLLVNLGFLNFRFSDFRLSRFCFFGNSGWNWRGLGVSGRSARTIRRHSVELWQDLVSHGDRKSTFQHFPVNWHFNVLEMWLLHFVHGLSRTPLLFSPRYLTNIFLNNILQKDNISSIGNLKIWKSKNPGSLTGAQRSLTS